MIYKNVDGTFSNKFQLDKDTGVLLKSSGGKLQARDSTDTSLVNIQAAPAIVDDDVVTKLDVSTFLHQVENNVSASTTNTSTASPTTYMTTTTAVLPIGTYRVDWFYTWEHSATNRVGRTRAMLDSVSLLGGSSTQYHIEEMSESANEISCCGFKYVTFVSSSTHTLSIEFSTSGGTITILNGRLAIFKVGL